MSLSLLNEYASSSDESEEEETVDKKEDSTKVSTDSSNKPSSPSNSKNYFVASDSDDSNDGEDGVLPGNLDVKASSTFSTAPGPSPFTIPPDQPVGPLYGPQPHPSQLYNYANYDQEYDLPGPSSAADEPPEKRQRILADDDVKRLIQRYECDTWNTEVPGELEIIDANVDRHLGGVREHLLRNITKIPAPPKASDNDEKKPGALAKRKHQITYLAYMAKSNEEQLQNEWAKNRLTKRQTQAKYGF